ncbi:unnamed protein product [Protopolystoma xenopodis]|uniref:NR LBD domain-containing protein n=1 Tax=Protopolystoma xenopodis TaxID=117903 RepID=A0A3S5BAW2_9PLAT|nr:unnamed protein product [Protopolystoma xenopodis]
MSHCSENQSSNRCPSSLANGTNDSDENSSSANSQPATDNVWWWPMDPLELIARSTEERLDALVVWARQLPGFTKFLSLQDQLALIKSGGFLIIFMLTATTRCCHSFYQCLYNYVCN